MGFEIPAGAGAAVVLAFAHATFHRNSPVYGRVISRGPKNQRSLYLTFDDGPHPSATGRILQVLEATGTPAAFFMVGANVDAFPELASEVAARGQTIGNHTYCHRKLHFKGLRFITAELGRTHESIVRVTGVEPRIFRAPHGFRNPFVAAAARRFAYVPFGWTFGVWDTDRPGASAIRRRVRAHLKPGAIVLLHDGCRGDSGENRTQTADALPGIIADAEKLGYEFRPLTQLLQK
jgi:peptidoglycan/xylan/chitin deacetylase (PgdA/CDA1 family)